MSNGIQGMLERFTAVYGPPNSENVGAFMAEYHFALKGYWPAIIDRMTDQMIREHSERWWPTPGKCVETCRAVAAKMERMKPPEHQLLTDDRDEPLGPEREGAKERVAALVAECKRGWAAEKVRQMEAYKPLNVEPPFTRTQRPEFEAMQRNSPNKGLHRKW